MDVGTDDIKLLHRLMEKLEYSFKQIDLLEEALTHTSYHNEHPKECLSDNERLEFLGDSVLQLVITTRIYQRDSKAAEGVMTRQRAEVVSEPSLAAVARQLDLGHYLRLGRGERRSGGADKDSILSDAMEALLGAVYLDRGYEAVASVVQRLFDFRVESAAETQDRTDYKTQLQELTQLRHNLPPVYLQTGVNGPDHCRIYQVEVRLDGHCLGHGEGRSKKAAQQMAARNALIALGDSK